MSLLPVNNSDSGAVARAKINAAISQLGEGFIVVYDTAANYTAANLILPLNYIAFETDGLTTTPKFKIPDGVTAWNSLPYAGGDFSLLEKLANKGIANGYASLDSGGKVPSAQLPSYVDDVLEYATLSVFPVTGESGKIYIDLSTNFQYRWSGSVYVQITSSSAVWGSISGLLSNQTDLQTVLNNKENTSNKNNTTLNASASEYPTSGLVKSITDTKANIQDGLVSGGLITVATYGGTGTLDDIKVAIATWVISLVQYTSLGDTYYFDIPLSASGLQRYIGIYGNNANAIVKVEGAESEYAVMPATPANTTLLGSILVTDGAYTGTDISGLLPKVDKATAADVIAGTNDTLYITSLANAVKAPKFSPAFTGTPTAPTAAAGTNSTQISTTAYVDAAVVLAVPTDFDYVLMSSFRSTYNY